MQLINNKRTFQNSFYIDTVKKSKFLYLKGIFLNMNYQKDLTGLYFN